MDYYLYAVSETGSARYGTGACALANLPRSLSESTLYLGLSANVPTSEAQTEVIIVVRNRFFDVAYRPYIALEDLLNAGSQLGRREQC